ncbi:hypothetical protein LJC33_07985 [Eubacteriales bacterium OttesenSCG-928-N13]|nr:hypothetical protein [Eubacteriales bacterium OttesenSCG-928-N13]
MNEMQIIERALNEGNGVLRLAPNWVPRAHCRPGRRLRLHPNDYYALGLRRGAIDERWFCSTTAADNGELTPEDEGLSYIVTRDGKEKALFLSAVEQRKGQIIGDALYEKHGRWPMFAKFFDNMGPLPHHIHHSEEYAQRVGMHGKPEMYFFPSQYNNYGAEFPFTFFGFNPEVSKEQVKQALIRFTEGDNKLLELSRAYKIELDTGWDVPTGVLHAPASLCTYEPQFSSDVYAMYQSVLYLDHTVADDMLWKTCPPDQIGNFDYLIEVMDWEKNVDPEFSRHRFMAPKLDSSIREDGGFIEWICYKSDFAAAKRLTVQPGCSMILREKVAYGLLCVQGHGKINDMDIASPTLIRYGQLTDDEFFVVESAAKEGVRFTNLSETEPLVMLYHFTEHPNRKAVEDEL